jgi:hypothetical protein
VGFCEHGYELLGFTSAENFLTKRIGIHVCVCLVVAMPNHYIMNTHGSGSKPLALLTKEVELGGQLHPVAI